MCGIAGLFAPDLNSGLLVRATEQMAESVSHRGPDGAGIAVVEGVGLAVAHRRLAIIDLTDTGHQPMWSRSGRWMVSFNGEIYNYVELRAQIEASGAALRGTSDTEVLVELIDRVGIQSALRMANGMFALSAWNHADRELYLARDRFGEKPLYWMEAAGSVAFASDIRAFRSVPGVELRIDHASATSMLRWSSIPHPFTIFERVHQTPPGGLVKVQANNRRLTVDTSVWWSLSDAIDESRVQPGRSPDDTRRLVMDTLRDAVQIRTRSDVQVGAFLSGGIDSSLVAYLAQEALGSQQLKTLTVSMPDLGFDEAGHAAAVARHIGSDHIEIEMSSAEAVDLITSMAEIYSEPFGDPSMLPTALLCKAASGYAKVCLSGDGGDELFAGYNRHVFGARAGAITQKLPQWTRTPLARVLRGSATLGVGRIVGYAPSQLRIPNVDLKLLKLAAAVESDEATWELLASHWPLAALPVLPHQPERPPIGRSLSPLEQLVWSDTVSVLPDQMLVKVDRASMAVGLEVRVPLLDPRLLGVSWSAPLSTNVTTSAGKHLLREAAYQLLPRHLIDRPKQGFDPPIGAWMRAGLRDWMLDLVSDSRCVSNGWLAKDALDAAVASHLAGSRDLETLLWPVMMLESWARSVEA